MRLTDHAATLFELGAINLERFGEIVDEALAHGDPDYEPDAFGLPPWRRRYGGVFCDAVVVDAHVLRRRARIRRSACPPLLHRILAWAS